MKIKNLQFRIIILSLLTIVCLLNSIWGADSSIERIIFSFSGGICTGGILSIIRNF